jgi:hypothetical protein
MGTRKRCALSHGGSTHAMIDAVKPCLETPGERIQNVWACIKNCGAQELVTVSTFHQVACSAWIPIWLRAQWVRDRDGKAGSKTSTAKDLKSVLKPFAHIPLIKPSVPCVINVVPGTWMTSKRHPSASFRAFSC